MKFKHTTIGTIKDVIETFKESRAELVEAANKAGKDIILVWSNGLAVMDNKNKDKDDPDRYGITNIQRASAFEPNTTNTDFAFPIVMNGFMSVAKPTKRADAAQAQIVKTDEAIAMCEERLRELENEDDTETKH